MKVTYIENRLLPKEIQYTDLFCDDPTNTRIGEWITIKGKYELGNIKSHNHTDYIVQSVTTLINNIIVVILVENDENKLTNKKTITKLFKGDLIY